MGKEGAGMTDNRRCAVVSVVATQHVKYQGVDFDCQLRFLLLLMALWLVGWVAEAGLDV